MVLDNIRKFLGRGLLVALALVLVAGMLPLSHAAAEEAQAQQQAAQPQDMQDMAMEAAHQEVAADAEPGDYLTGQMLYTGQKRFTNGGPPCMSCHNASVGALGGGCLGPDLTMAYADPSKNPLINAVWINNPGTPVMGPVFSNRPVTDEEAANLRAFFEQTCKGEVVPVPTGTFTIVGIGGFIGILIVFNIIWSGRYRNRVKGTAHDALWRNYGGKGGR